MHEYSIVQALLDQCELHAAAHHATVVTKVVVQIGRYSGVESELLMRAFETFKEGTIAASAALEIVTSDDRELLLLSLEAEQP
ncbi:MAG: hydrogenase maturation nickel metallochaperone HypA [Campylobacterales bacterium]